MNNYDDIINLPHHVSKNHSRMSIQNRAAQFSPFSALTGYEDAINEVKRITTEKRVLASDMVEELNRNLNEIEENINKYNYKITYFIKDQKKSGGKYVSIIAKVIGIDTYQRIIICNNNIKININDLYQIENMINENYSIFR